MECDLVLSSVFFSLFVSRICFFFKYLNVGVYFFSLSRINFFILDYIFLKGFVFLFTFVTWLVFLSFFLVISFACVFLLMFYMRRCSGFIVIVVFSVNEMCRKRVCLQENLTTDAHRQSSHVSN